jgi:IS5 family transposase
MAAILATFALSSAIVVGLSIWATSRSQHRAAVLEIAARQRTLSERYVKEVLLVRSGAAADPATTAVVLRESAHALLEGGLALVNAEPDTTAWFAVKMGPSSYGIFDVFPSDAGRQVHLQGRVAEALMAELDRQLGAGGFLVKEGTMIDATLIEAQAARPRDDRVNEAPPQDEPAEPRVDPDAAFTKKEGKTVYGYKAHVAVDRGSGLIRRARLTPANVHDTREADALVMGDERAIYADMAYATHARRAALKARGIKDRIMHRPNRHHPELPRWQRRRNTLIRAARATVERTFGTLKRGYGYRQVRYFSLLANAIELQLKCFAFNLRRLAVLAARQA